MQILSGSPWILPRPLHVLAQPQIFGPSGSLYCLQARLAQQQVDDELSMVGFSPMNVCLHGLMSTWRHGARVVGGTGHAPRSQSKDVSEQLATNAPMPTVPAFVRALLRA